MGDQYWDFDKAMESLLLSVKKREKNGLSEFNGMKKRS